MSVINDMLRDLDARKAPERGGAMGEGHSLVQAPVKPKWHLPVAILLVVALMLGAFWLGLSSEGSNDAEHAYQPPSSEGVTNTNANRAVKPLVDDIKETQRVVVQAPKTNTSVAKKPEQTNKDLAISPPVEPKKADFSKPSEAKSAAVVKPALENIEAKIEQAPLVQEKNVSQPNEKSEQKAFATVENDLREDERKQAQEPASNANISSEMRLTPTAQDQQVASTNQKRLDRGDVSFAIQALYAFIAASEQDSYSRTVLATYFLQAQRFAEAGDVLIPVSVDDLPALRVLKARWLLQTYDLERAIVWLESNPPKASSGADYLALLANYYQQAGQFEKSVDTYLTLLDFDSEKADWWLGLGLGYDRLKRYDDAAYAYREAIALPKLKAALLSFARNRLEQLSR